MTREIQIRFCLLCSNREFSREHGVICHLTDAPADFQEDCGDFRIDEVEHKRLATEKIRTYGLNEEKGLIADLVNENQFEYRLTSKFLMVKDSEQGYPLQETYVGKSKIKYALLGLIPLTAMTLILLQTSTKSLPRTLAFSLICTTVFLWILADYFRNRNDFTISAKGFRLRGQFIPWKIVLGTIIKTERSRNGITSLMLITAAKEDIEIKLTMLQGTTRYIENMVELYKERFRALSK